MKEQLIQEIYDQHDVACNQKYDNTLPYSFHLKAVRAQGLKFAHLLDNLPASREIKEFIDIPLVGHDLIEDGRMTWNDVVLKIESHSLTTKLAKEIADVIYAVTDEKGKTRQERKNDQYYKQLKENRVAVFVKLSDLAANMIYSKLFNTRMYAMYKVEFGAFKAKLWGKDLEDMFNYVGGL